MNETRKNITEYTKALVGLKERVITVTILLVLSTVMMTMVSFAWLALSQNPEVSGVTTSVAANGNLEIALASGKNEPATSQVGDSNKELIEKNITWGNLINLSDPVYGLDNLILRPALLNKSDLTNSPLYGAEYTADGRVERLNSSFAYSTWVELSSRFEVSNKLGVRAITSTKMGEAGEYAIGLYDTQKDAEDANARAANTYLSITQNSSYMTSLASIMGTYMTARMNASQEDSESLTNPTMDKTVVSDFCNMYAEFVLAMEQELEAIVLSANLQLYVLNAGDTSAYTIYTAESLMSDSQLNKNKIKIKQFEQFKKDYNQVLTDLNKIKEIVKLDTIKWVDSGLPAIIENFINIGKCTVQVKGSSEKKEINSIGASDALSYNNKTCYAVITNGILKRFEERVGSNMNVGSTYNGGKGLKVQATGKRLGMTMDGTIYALITTDASAPSHFSVDIKYATDSPAEGGINNGGKGVEVAKDTFGVAIDLWVRTNASGSYLTLQGNILTETKNVRATAVAKDGTTVVDLYTITLENTLEDGSSENYTLEVYYISEEKKWYVSGSHRDVTEEIGSNTPIPKMIEVETVIGYEGENRVWDKSAGLSVNSTTQGSGSCYVYYADSPEDQAKSLKLLAAMNVAFIDDGGNLLAAAIMDTEHYYADNGKVIVPLVLNPSESIDLGMDYDGRVLSAITDLERNVAKRITIIMYLDGTKLTNDDVLAASDIQGQFNIQFGTSVSLYPITNEKLADKEVVVSADTSVKEFDYDTATEPMTTKVTVYINGAQPSKVTAFFIRSINAAQGTREPVITNFTCPNNDGVWIADYTFMSPGKYILRSVQLDGVEYDLEQRPQVVVHGFTISNVMWTASETNNAAALTAERSVSTSVSIKFASSDEKKLPKTVSGRFIKKDGTTASVSFVYNSVTGIWTGTATFLTSGDYELQYLILDGEYVELAENLRKYISVSLGITARVFTDSLNDFTLPSEMADEALPLKMKVRIYDDTGVAMTGLSTNNTVTLTYRLNTSSLVKKTCEIIWNSATEYYEGEFNAIDVGAGIFVFANVTVGENIISIATESPRFIIRSPKAPKYYGFEPVKEQYAPNNDAKLNIQLAYASTAEKSTSAVILNLKTNDRYIVDGVLVKTDNFESEGETVSVSTFSYRIPNTDKGTQDGYWKIESVSIWDVYDEGGNWCDKNSPILFDISGEDNTTKVIESISIHFVGQKDNLLEGTFMQAHEITKDHDMRIEVQIYDFENNKLNIPNNKITLTYKYDRNSAQYGGYTSNGITLDEFNIELVANESGKVYVQDKSFTLLYAGTYTPTKFSFSIIDINKTVEYKGADNAVIVAMPRYTVKSTTPSVKITKINPSGSMSVDRDGNTGDGHTDSVSPQISPDGSSAEVYFKCTINSNLCSADSHEYTQPSVFITMSGFGYASEANLTFSNEEETISVTYTWNGDGEKEQKIGVLSNSEAKIPAGKIEAKTIILIYDGVKFEVSTYLTINNPY